MDVRAKLRNEYLQKAKDLGYQPLPPSNSPSPQPLENTEAQRIEGTVDAGVFGIHTVGIDMMFFETRLQIVRAIFNVSLAWLNPRQDHKTPSHHLAFIFVNHHNLHGGKKFSLVNPLHV